MTEQQPRTVAMVSLTTGDPDDENTIVTAFTWLIGDSGTADAFRAVMTGRYGEPLQSMQPGYSLGTEDGLVILRDPGQEGAGRG